jgi:hypothetical protein
VGDRLDVAERLAEGVPAVEHTQTYVRACQTLGYEQSDMTSRPSQIRDWYGSEDGLDLHALDRDCAQLRAAGAAVMEGLRIQRAQVAELTAAWTGLGGDAAVAFLQRHCDEASVLATEVRAAAQRCESLRDNLWFLLDSKVATAIAIDDRTQPQRPAWLAAAVAVTTGAVDGPPAEDVVQQQIKPYVDNDIRNDWVTAMRSSQAGVATSYDMVIDRMAAVPSTHFDIPADLVPGRAPFQPASPIEPAMTEAITPAAVPPTVAPAAAMPPADPAPAASSTPPAPASSATPAPAPDLRTALGDASAMPAGAGDLGGGLSGLGGLGGLASRIVDAMGGLLGSAADQFANPSALDDALGGKDPFDKDAVDEDPFHPDDENDDADAKPDTEAEESDEPEETEKAEEDRPVDGSPAVEAASPAGAPPSAETPPPADTPPPVDAPPPAVAPAPTAGPATGGSTPCEIAADQLPQAGQ